MMTLRQRMGFLGMAVAIAVVAIVILALGSGPDETAEDAASPAAEQTATPTATSTADDGESTPEPTATPTPTPRPQPPLLTAGRVREVRVTEGETVRFRVRSDVAEEIHVHGYDLTKDVPAGRTTTMAFRATITGIFEIELHGAGEPIGELRVDPG
jgi:hypothetical protein